MCELQMLLILDSILILEISEFNYGCIVLNGKTQMTVISVFNEFGARIREELRMHNAMNQFADESDFLLCSNGTIF